jgi:hypothetical protein
MDDEPLHIRLDRTVSWRGEGLSSTNPFFATEDDLLEELDELEEDMAMSDFDFKREHPDESVRARLHSPKSDYFVTAKGEMCKNASSLCVDDLVVKYNS